VFPFLVGNDLEFFSFRLVAVHPLLALLAPLDFVVVGFVVALFDILADLFVIRVGTLGHEFDEGG